MAKNKEAEKDAPPLLDHLLSEAGVSVAVVRARSLAIGPKASDHDVDVVVNEHFYGREREFFRKLVRAYAGGA